MDNYIIKFFSGGTLEITSEQHKNLIGKEGLVFLKGLDESLNISDIARIVPKSKADDLEDKRNQKEGVLHDGTVVIRHFGSWYMDGEFDGNGKPTRRIDSTYYPEVARDVVVSKKEFNLKYKALPRKQRLALMIDGTEAPRIGSTEKLDNLLGGQVLKAIERRENE